MMALTWSGQAEPQTPPAKAQDGSDTRLGGAPCGRAGLDDAAASGGIPSGFRNTSVQSRMDGVRFSF